MSLELALKIARSAHHAQTDKAGVPYILHPVRVADLLLTQLEKEVALLHDVIEDTPWTDMDLLAVGFEYEVVRLVVVLTRQAHESYDAYLNRITKEPVALHVKLADLKDNLNVLRLPSFSSNTGHSHLVEKYHAAYQKLSGVRL